jgi:hypothetical protein
MNATLWNLIFLTDLILILYIYLKFLFVDLINKILF